jgi:sec-independent protein translocase protein TatA
MGGLSLWHIMLVLVVVLILFGAGKLPQVMGDLAKGVKNFKAGLKDDSDDAKPGSTTVQSDSGTSDAKK